MNYCRIISYIVIFCLFVLPLQTKPVFAAYMTSIDLIRFCGSKDAEEQKLCYGYIAGVIDYHNLTRSLDTAPTINFCVPQHLSLKEVSAKVMTYLRTRPEHDQFIASPAISLALFHYYPCKMRKPSRKKR